MQVRFLGGAAGVGASCLAVELAGRWVLVDAGVRTDPSRDRLPDLAALDEVDLAAVLVTHAHSDHIGALPLVHQHFPHVPIYATLATRRLMEVMLTDALRVMERRAAEELEIPLYDASLVEAMLARIRPLASGAQGLPELPGVTLHATRAGHVAGAVCLGFDGPDGRLIVSGDVSVTPQRTVAGAELPPLARPDLLVLESTYGARLHANRQAEEGRLAEAVAAGVKTGHVLIPAFALGRAQEILLILRAAQRDRRIPEFPIYVDGLVRTVCAAYSSIPDALTLSLQRRVLNGQRLFFGGTVQAVETPAQRERLLEGPPCCIIASSGMLTGGPSAHYAARLVDRPEASILITGYQDEESPGRRLLEAASGAVTSLTINGRSIPLRCRVGKYGLSAHADAAQLAGLVAAVRPRAVALVHGDPEARAALAERLRQQARVHLPGDGESLEIEPATRQARSSLAASAPPPLPVGLGGGEPPEVAGLERLWEAVGDGSGVQRLSLRELVRAWYGEDAGESAAAEMERALELGQPYFAPLPEVPGLWRVRDAVEMRRARAAGPGPAAPGGRRPDQAAIQAVIDRHLGRAPDLYRRGVDASTGAVTLRFFFPEVAAARHAAALAAIAEEAGVSVTIEPQPHQEQLKRAALAALPDGVTPLREPSIRFEARSVSLRCAELLSADTLRAAGERFLLETGWRLELQHPEAAAAPNPSDPEMARGAPDRIPYDEVMEVARELFPPASGCYRISADQERGVLTLRFHFPETARARHAADLAALEADTGWAVRLHPHPHQAVLMEAARKALPPGLSPLGEPSLSPTTREALLRCRGDADPAALEEAARAFTDLTGWKLVLQRQPGP